MHHEEMTTGMIWEQVYPMIDNGGGEGGGVIQASRDLKGFQIAGSHAVPDQPRS
jgi:hypothetical protein